MDTFLVLSRSPSGNHADPSVISPEVHSGFCSSNVSNLNPSGVYLRIVGLFWGILPVAFDYGIPHKFSAEFL